MHSTKYITVVITIAQYKKHHSRHNYCTVQNTYITVVIIIAQYSTKYIRVIIIITQYKNTTVVISQTCPLGPLAPPPARFNGHIITQKNTFLIADNAPPPLRTFINVFFLKLPLPRTLLWSGEGGLITAWLSHLEPGFYLKLCMYIVYCIMYVYI